MIHKNIIILGASFITGNLGVSALAWSVINLLRSKWPDAEVNLLGGRSKSKVPVSIKDSSIEIPSWPVRYSPKLFMVNHIVWMLLAVSLIKLFPFLKKMLVKKGSTLDAIYRSDLITDMTGGDSFSDIYGMKRFIFGYLIKSLCQVTGKPFVMLPQTYGPFKGALSRCLARRVLKKTTKIYSRDKEGMAVVKELIGETDKVVLSPDVAFVLDATEIEQSAIGNEQLSNVLFDVDNKSQVVGLNVSGLLYNGGYTGNNEFGLKCDYKDLLKEIIEYFTSLPDSKVLLVPHVVPEGWETENDLIACHKLRDSLSDDIKEKVFIAEPDEGQPFFDQCEIKYIIGKCDFFMGSRMHSTIAAMSQCVPAVGMAYSKKFAGVFQTVGVDDCVLDMRQMDESQILDRIKQLYAAREYTRQKLTEIMPGVQKKVMSLFDAF